ncbi:glycosyltransferase [Rasiella rasia]|uniref:Glycosyltransferase n=1 Tax=Rasiella rasia TaxID=2744027 RepID=A0A6G6GI93_9FLAO|nr:glycosyltransferase [Rasiella rasia]QIE58268.1 glycosyltransferase [Rasiella rasia]
MKVLHVINSLAAGGAEKLVSELTSALSETCEVSLFTFQNSQDIFRENLGGNVHFYSVAEGGFFSIKKLRVLSKLIKQHDVIHAHLFPTFYIVAFLSLFRRRKKFIYTEHNTHNKRRKWFFWLLEKWVYARYNTIICISKGVEKSLQNWIGIATNTKIITNFVDLEKIAGISKKKTMLPDVSNSVPLVMVGSFSEQKDQETLVKTISVLPEQYLLLLIGDGPKRVFVEEQVAKLKLTQRVFFLGIQKDVISILKHCKYGILSSNWEGFGIVALEYMASGLIALGTDVSGLNEVIRVKENLFTVGNHQQLANRIVAIETNEGLTKTIESKQNSLILDFDIAASVKQHLEVYKLS